MTSPSSLTAPKLKATLFGVVCEAKRSLSASKESASKGADSIPPQPKKSDPTTSGGGGGRSFSSRSFVSLLSSFPFRYALASDGFRAASSNSNSSSAASNHHGSTPTTNLVNLPNSLSSRSFANDSSLESVNNNQMTDESEFIKKESISSLEMESVRLFLQRDQSISDILNNYQ